MRGPSSIAIYFLLIPFLLLLYLLASLVGLMLDGDLMIVKSGNQACAACKYQRRKCKPDCPLAPYFLPENGKQFLNAHRLFGLRNILRIIKDLDPSQKDEAMRSIIYESDMRQRYPVRGCVAAIQTLQLQIHHAREELQYLRTYLDACHNCHQSLQLMPSAASSSQQTFQLESPTTLSLLGMERQLHE